MPTSVNTGKGSNVLVSETNVNETNFGFNESVDGVVTLGNYGDVDNSVSSVSTDNSVSNSNNTTTISDNSQTTTNNQNSGNTISGSYNTTTDHGAVDRAFDAADDAIAAIGTALTNSNNFARDALQRVSTEASGARSDILRIAQIGYDAVDDAFEDLGDAYSTSLGALSAQTGKLAAANAEQLNALASFQRSDTAASFDKLVKYAAVGVTIVVLAVIVTRKGASV